MVDISAERKVEIFNLIHGKKRKKSKSMRCRNIGEEKKAQHFR
jgi:hypothetical protein